VKKVPHDAFLSTGSFFALEDYAWVQYWLLGLMPEMLSMKEDLRFK
jgi:hypothetical protein